MNEQSAVHEAVTAIFTSQLAAARAEAEASNGFSTQLWKALNDNGFTTVAARESSGGSGGTLADLAEVLQVAGYHGAPVPLAEHNVAALLMDEAGLDVIAGPLALVTNLGSQPVEVVPATTPGNERLTGTMHSVAWGAVAKKVLVLAPSGGQSLLGVADSNDAQVTARPNGANEPVADIVLPPSGIPLTSVPVTAARGRTLLRLARALLITGSVRRVLGLTVRYTRQRKQFGQPIGTFQAVSHQLAELAGAVEQAEAICDLAVDVLVRGGSGAEPVLAAKICTGLAAATACRIGHQLHGALGVTQEYELHHHTQRLLAWRDLDGSEDRAALELGQAITARGGDALWELLTDVPEAVS